MHRQKYNYLTLKLIIMNKTELIAAVAQKSGMTKADTAKSFNALMDVTTASLKAGNKITLIGFGSFFMQERPARKGKNPRTGKTITIPAKNMGMNNRPIKSQPFQYPRDPAGRNSKTEINISPAKNFPIA